MRQSKSGKGTRPFSFNRMIEETRDEFRRKQLEREASRLLHSAGLCSDGRECGEHTSIPLIFNNNGPRH